MPSHARSFSRSVFGEEPYGPQGGSLAVGRASGWGPVDVTQTQKHPPRFLLLTQLGLPPKVISFARLEDIG